VLQAVAFLPRQGQEVTGQRARS